MSAPSGNELTRRQKAAALMMAVGSDQATELMTFLTEAEVEALAKEIAALREVPLGALGQVVEDLHAQIEGRTGVLEGGIDYARELLARWRGPGEEAAERIAPPADAPFRLPPAAEPDQQGDRGSRAARPGRAPPRDRRGGQRPHVLLRRHHHPPGPRPSGDPALRRAQGPGAGSQGRARRGARRSDPQHLRPGTGVA